eukprot:5640769-Pyramimonas_sp.AAC.1
MAIPLPPYDEVSRAPNRCTMRIGPLSRRVPLNLMTHEGMNHPHCMSQVHPGIINSDFMERAQFRGEDAEAASNRMVETLQVRIPYTVYNRYHTKDSIQTT